MNVLWMCCAPQLPSFPVAKLTYVPTNNNDIVWQTLGRVGNALPTTIAWRAVARRFWIKHAVACLDLTPNAGGGEHYERKQFLLATVDRQPLVRKRATEHVYATWRGAEIIT